VVKKTKYFDPTTPVEKGLDNSNIEILSNILTQVKYICPVNKNQYGGTLRNSYMFVYNSLTGQTEKGHNDSSGETSNNKISISRGKHFGAIGSNEDYAPYVEFGTRKMSSQPHLQPAVEIVLKGAGTEDALNIIKKTQRENMKRFSK
jgi:HK97 gp10 family phage protein